MRLPAVRELCAGLKSEDGRGPVAGSFIVRGHFARHVGFAPGEESGKALGDTVMALGAARGRLTLVQHFAIEAMREYVEGRGRPAGELVITGAAHEGEPAGHGIA